MIGLIKAVDPWLETVVLLGILWLGYRIVNGSWRCWQLAVGIDGRYSSSRFHGLCWTIVVFVAYTVLYLARVHAGSTQAFQTIPPNVLTALGLSLGTTVVAVRTLICGMRQLHKLWVRPRAQQPDAPRRVPAAGRQLVVRPRE